MFGFIFLLFFHLICIRDESGIGVQFRNDSCQNVHIALSLWSNKHKNAPVSMIALGNFFLSGRYKPNCSCHTRINAVNPGHIL